MRKRAGVEFHRLDAHQTRKQHGEERKKTIIPPCPHLRLNFTLTDATSPKFPPEPNNKSNIDQSERAEPQKHQNITMERLKKADLRLTLLGLGCLRRDIVARMTMVVGSMMMMMMNGGDGG